MKWIGLIAVVFTGVLLLSAVDARADEAVTEEAAGHEFHRHHMGVFLGGGSRPEEDGGKEHGGAEHGFSGGVGSKRR